MSQINKKFNIYILNQTTREDNCTWTIMSPDHTSTINAVHILFTVLFSSLLVSFHTFSWV